MIDNKSTNVVRTENFDIENPTISVSTVDSDISVVESENGRTTIEIHAGSEQGRDSAQNAQITANGATIKVELNKKKGGLKDFFNFGGGGVSIMVRMPSAGILDLKTVSADIETDVTVKNLDASTVSGDVTIHKNPTMHCKVKTVSGDVVTRTYSACDYSLKSVSGDISVHVAPGLEIEVDGKSLSGEMTSEILLDADSDAAFKSAGAVSISASTISGDFSLARN